MSFRNLDVFSVEEEIKVVDSIIPFAGSSCLNGKCVGPKHEPQCLDPREVSFPSSRSEANEAGVDLEVGVGDKAEMLAFLSMEVK